jgi:hypothetical protein
MDGIAFGSSICNESIELEDEMDDDCNDTDECIDEVKKVTLYYTYANCNYLIFVL